MANPINFSKVRSEDAYRHFALLGVFSSGASKSAFTSDFERMFQNGAEAATRWWWNNLTKGMPDNHDRIFDTISNVGLFLHDIGFDKDDISEFFKKNLSDRFETLNRSRGHISPRNNCHGICDGETVHIPTWGVTVCLGKCRTIRAR